MVQEKLEIRATKFDTFLESFGGGKQARSGGVFSYQVGALAVCVEVGVGHQRVGGRDGCHCMRYATTRCADAQRGSMIFFCAGPRSVAAAALAPLQAPLQLQRGVPTRGTADAREMHPRKLLVAVLSRGWGPLRVFILFIFAKARLRNTHPLHSLADHEHVLCSRPRRNYLTPTSWRSNRCRFSAGRRRRRRSLFAQRGGASLR